MPESAKAQRVSDCSMLAHDFNRPYAMWLLSSMAVWC